MASAEPDTPAAFNATQMLGFLAEVDELLVKAGTTHELHLYVAGGAVIAAKTDSRLTGRHRRRLRGDDATTAGRGQKK